MIEIVVLDKIVRLKRDWDYKYTVTGSEYSLGGFHALKELEDEIKRLIPKTKKEENNVERL